MKRILFIDRDGTLLDEAYDFQIDQLEKLGFYPYMFEYMGKIAREFDYELVMVTNQDGLGTPAFPENAFWPLHNLVMKSLEREGIHFSAVHIDRTFAKDNAPTRKPGIGMLTEYLNNSKYDISNSFVIGDRLTDMMLAGNLGCKGIWLNNGSMLGAKEIADKVEAFMKSGSIVLETTEWKKVYEFLKSGAGKFKESVEVKQAS